MIGTSESPREIDFTAFINKAKSLKPDVFYNDFFAGDAIASFKQAYEWDSQDFDDVNAFITNVVGSGIPKTWQGSMP